MDWNDERWTTLKGGYRVVFDPRASLLRLRSTPYSDRLWSEFIQDLYHQGDVGEASYASVPELASLLPAAESLPWQLVSLVQYIEEARSVGTNPPLPTWIAEEYFDLIDIIGRRCLTELNKPTNELQNQSLIGFIALWKGMRVYAKAVGNYSENELKLYLPE